MSKGRALRYRGDLSNGLFRVEALSEPGGDWSEVLRAYMGWGRGYGSTSLAMMLLDERAPGWEGPLLQEVVGFLESLQADDGQPFGEWAVSGNYLDHIINTLRERAASFRVWREELTRPEALALAEIPPAAPSAAAKIRRPAAGDTDAEREIRAMEWWR